MDRQELVATIKQRLLNAHGRRPRAVILTAPKPWEEPWFDSDLQIP